MTDEQLKNLLCCAFEGGANYWYDIDDRVLAPAYTMDDFGEGGRMQDPENYWHWSQLIPFVEGCFLVIGTLEEDMHPAVLDRKALERGLDVMRDKYPRHYADAVGETEDAVTGDVFLQCCVYGEVVFG